MGNNGNNNTNNNGNNMNTNIPSNGQMDNLQNKIPKGPTEANFFCTAVFVKEKKQDEIMAVQSKTSNGKRQWWIFRHKAKDMAAKYKHWWADSCEDDEDDEDKDSSY